MAHLRTHIHMLIFPVKQIKKNKIIYTKFIRMKEIIQNKNRSN
jgi:hypothetical protein